MAIAEPKISLDELASTLADYMTEHCIDNQSEYVLEGQPYIDIVCELELAYEATYGHMLPDELYKPLEAHKRIKKAERDMEDIVREYLADLPAHNRYWYGTPEQQLRERGMSIRDFL